MAFASGSWQADVQKGAYEEAEILLEAEGVPDFAAEDMISSLSAKARSKEPKPQRKHHYTFDVDDNGLDINGFILHTDKHKGKRHKFRVYLDSNENGRFDKNDQLIGRTGLKHKHASKGVGNLLDDDEIGELIVDFKRPPSKRPDPDAMTLDQQIQQLKEEIMNGGLDMQFKLPNGTSIPITLDQAKARLSALEIEQHAMDAQKSLELNLENTFNPACWFHPCT